MVQTLSIPIEDLVVINKVLNPNGQVEEITKKINGGVALASREEIKKGFVIQDFNGRFVKHQVSVVDNEGNQVIVATAGQRYNDIPLDKRQMAHWSESDFQ